MSNDDSGKHIHELIEKAGVTKDSGDAMRFAQAALNAANALAVLAHMKKNCGDAK